MVLPVRGGRRPSAVQLHEQIDVLRRKCQVLYMKDYRTKDLRKTVANLKRDNHQLRDEHRIEFATKKRELKDAISQRDKAQLNLQTRYERYQESTKEMK